MRVRIILDDLPMTDLSLSTQSAMSNREAVSMYGSFPVALGLLLKRVLLEIGEELDKLDDGA